MKHTSNICCTNGGALDVGTFDVGAGGVGGNVKGTLLIVVDGFDCSPVALSSGILRTAFKKALGSCG